MWGLKTPFSHVAVKMTDSDTNQIMYYQASGLSVNCVSEAEFLSVETIVKQKDVQVNEKAFIAGKSWALAQLGKPYSILAILGFASQILLGMIGIQIKNPFKATSNAYVCSQFAAVYIEECDNITLDVTEMTPKALYCAISSLPDTWT